MKKEGAEKYARINNIVDHLRKYKHAEDKNRQEILKKKMKEMSMEEDKAKEQRNIDRYNKLTFDNNKQPITTDHNGNALKIRKTNMEKLPPVA